jgi:hypothetical protein
MPALEAAPAQQQPVAAGKAEMSTEISLQPSLHVRIHKNRCVCVVKSIIHGCAGERECSNAQPKKQWYTNIYAPRNDGNCAKQWDTNLYAPELDVVLADRDKAAVVRIASNRHDWVDVPLFQAHHLTALPVYDGHHVFMLSPDAYKMPPVLGEAHTPHTPLVKPLSLDRHRQQIHARHIAVPHAYSRPNSHIPRRHSLPGNAPRQ